MFNAAKELCLWNTHFDVELQLDENLLALGNSFNDILDFFILRGDYGKGDLQELRKKYVSVYWKQQETQTEITLKNGKTYDILSHLDEDGNLILTYTDVTLYKWTENALRDSEARFRDFTAAASDWYWELDKDLRFIFVTDTVLQYNGGVKPEEFYGKTRQELSLRQDLQSLEWQQHLADLEAHRPFKDFEYSFVDKDLMRHEISISGRPLYDDEGNFSGYRGVGRDIGERKKMENSLREHQELLERQIVDLRDREERLEHQATELVSIADELAVAEEKMKFLANHDALTGLPSLRLCQDRIETAMASSRRSNSQFALMFIDLDGFKAVNDTYGHDAGDAVLINVAKRIQEHTREVDTVARIGGDEFVVVFSGMEEKEQVSHLAERLIKSMNTPFDIGTAKVEIGLSIGIAIYPMDDETVDGLVRRADNAMYQVKQGGKNNFRFAGDE